MQLLGTLCEKKHDGSVVMDNKHYTSVHIGYYTHGQHFHSPLTHENTTSTHAITRDMHTLSTCIQHFKHGIYCNLKKKKKTNNA